MARTPARIALIAMLLSGSALAHAQASLPQGGSVALGNAAIHGGASSVTVDQTSQRAVVNWDSFSVGQGASVTFNQPNVSAAILNRVTGAAASTIAGTVSGNGQMFLVNPNGIAITPSGTVAMGGGFVASTLDISDRDFANASLSFSGSGTGTVSNSGAISIGSGGFAALLGGKVASSGTIAAPLGRIGLGAGRQATLDLTGDGFLQVVLPSPASGDDALVEMAGKLSGARIELRAATVSDAIRNAVNVPGALSAQGAHAEGGTVILDGGAGGAVRVAGSVDASGATQGGAITLTGKDIDLDTGASLAATGGSAGGTVLVGGGLHGAGGLPQATSVSMAAGSSVDVSAMGDGQGGTAVLWSDVADPASLTRFAGTIRARGAGSGAGGMVETSGHQVDSAGGLVDAGASMGAGGTWLIDPADSTITQSIATSYANTLGTGTDVLNSVTGSITWQSGVSLAKTGSTASTLTLQAGNASGSSPITLTGATITSANSALNLVLWTRYNSTGHDGPISITGSTINTNGGSVWMGGGLPGGTFKGLAVGANPVTSYTGNIPGIYLGTSSITTGAGSISLRAQSNASTLNNGTNNVGIWLDTGTSLTTTSGSIAIAGDLLGKYASGTGVMLGGRSGSATGNVLITSGSGTITIAGTGADSTGGSTGQRDALTLVARSAGDQTIVRSDSGAIALSGGASFSTNNYTSGNTAGVRLESDTVTGQVGIVSSSGAIAITGSNTLEAIGPNADGLILSAANAAGSIRIGDDGSNTASGAITINANSINQSNSNATSGSIKAQTRGALTIQPSGTSFTYLRAGSGILSFGSDWDFGGSLTGFTLGRATNTASLTLSNALSVLGPISITGGSVALNAALSANGAISLTALGAGGLSSSSAGTISSSGTLTLDTEGAAATGTMLGAITNAASLTKSGAGAVTLSGTNTYSGVTALAAGTLLAGSNSAFGGLTTLSIASGAVLDLQGFSTTVGSLSGAGVVTNGAAGGATLTTGGANSSTSFSGILQDGTGILSLTKAGSGTLSLSGTHAYSGPTIINGGTVQIAGNGTLGSGSYAGAITLGSGTTLEMSSTADQILSGALSGAGALVKDTGASTLTLSGANSYTGATTLSSGSLNLNGSWNGGGGTLQLNVASGASFAATGAVTAAGLLLSGAGSYSLTGANHLATLSASAPVGQVTVNNLDALTVESLSSTGAVQIAAVGSDLTLASGAVVTSSASGDAVSLLAGQRFVNQAGAGAVTTPNGRWLIYAASPSTSSFGGLDSGNTAIWGVSAMGSMAQTGNRYLFAEAPVLTLTAADRTKTYGDTVSFGTVVGTDYTVSGLRGGVSGAFLPDTLATALSGSPTLSSGGAAASASVGTGAYAITMGQGSLAGLDGYQLALADGVLTVNKAALTVTASDAAKTYDGLAYSGGNGVTYAGFVNGEAASVLGGSLAYVGTAQGAVNAGTYSLSGSGLSSGNYAITYAPGVLAVSKVALVVTANDASKTYDGLAYSGGNGASYAGFVNGETASVLGGSLVYGGSAQGAVNAGTYVLTSSGLSSANYTITYSPGMLTVNRAALAVTANDASKTYDGLAYSGGNGVTYAGFVNGETASVLGGALAYGGTAQGAVNAGAYGLTASGLSSGNYAISYAPGTLAVQKAALTVTANNVTKTYDGLAYSGGNGVTYAGFVNGETTSVLSGALTYGGAAQGAVNAGTYGLAASGLSSGNYAISYVPGMLTVNQAALTVTANDASKTYDGLAYSGGNGVTYAGFVNGETASVLGGALAYGGSAQGAVNAGTYGLAASGLSSGNYAITYAPATLVVNKSPLIVTANDASKTYDGLAYSGGNGVAYAGFVNGETASVLSGALVYGGAAQGAINAGGYGLTASGLQSGNYVIAYRPGTLTVGTRSILVTADSVVRQSGAPNPLLTYTIAGDGLASGDRLMGTLTTSATTDSPPGLYLIEVGSLSAGANYQMRFMPGVLEVGRADLPSNTAPSLLLQNFLPAIATGKLESSHDRACASGGTDGSNKQDGQAIIVTIDFCMY
ncbi:MBG domain-containing protein [Novosphingobium terrae]|uniref:MBG domain-containing protein n=1 Tax=Novosphingobium terrae TaxID=2726189 RepID=UPI00197FDDEE|nr:MBG domain-containing protein [Novosphingobium terrae]